MSRPLRIEYPGAYYHIMNRGLAYQDVFSDRSDREQFLDLLSECHEMWGIRVLAYCLLNNHYHLLIQTPQANLSRVMRHLDGLHTQRYNRRHKRDGPLFRGRYKAIVVDAEMESGVKSALDSSFLNDRVIFPPCHVRFVLNIPALTTTS